MDRRQQSRSEGNALNISAGKLKGLQAVSDRRGVIAALAIDQRSALRALIAQATGINPDKVAGEMLTEYKEVVSRILTPHCSAILLDPEYGLPAGKLRAKNAGLLLAYEQTGYDKAVFGRLPRLLDGWSVQRLVNAGADCVKALLYYSPSSPSSINAIKQDWVERIGSECAAADLPFFLELVSYQEGVDEKGAEYAHLKPDAVTGGIEEFSSPRYKVDVLKVGVPVTMAYVQGSPSCVDEIRYTREEAKAHFRRAASAARVPFLYLSEGVSNETFSHALEIASEAGVPYSGVLCGRATWKDGVPIFVRNGVAALEDWLNQDGIRNIQNVNLQLAAATPWFQFLGANSIAALS
jgi:tagatose 1,6-diphosphate aldolase